ncbi:MAG TPA: hypothetical protein VKP30_13000 [Polyangiaceae bacterium]|nr:hypothetical protein [Polyangiaceae bacterium]
MESHPSQWGVVSVVSGMSLAKQLLLACAVGAALGFLCCSIFGQSAVSLLFGSLGGTFTCKADVEQALQRFVRLQLYSALSGAVLVALLTWLVRRALGKKKSARVSVRPASGADE